MMRKKKDFHNFKYFIREDMTSFEMVIDYLKYISKLFDDCGGNFCFKAKG